MIRNFFRIMQKNNNRHISFNEEFFMFANSLVISKKSSVALGKIALRSLAKYENMNELKRTLLEDSINNGENYILIKVIESMPTYEQLKQSSPSNMEAYLKSYKSRYKNKKGLRKLDCYYEKNMFKEINKIEKLLEQKNITKGRIKKKIYKKYGLPLILLTLLPLFALIIPVKKIGRRHFDKKCTYIFSKGNGGKKFLGYGHRECKFEQLTDNYTMYIFLFISIFIVISFIIYNYIKVMKYRRIKAGMSK
ncbi:hypothetical protein PVNG_06027 [Plasmodium vivax North Korean]|uniref:Uncharacterized protein n=1 Tax=Plasmodium vivax North Korean TaxID=1035514 RepID=A0A0J9TLW7_PLAVI|nr:hypothetical protein PVNG_06027 [Plasmodium vivax North Korean]